MKNQIFHQWRSVLVAFGAILAQGIVAQQQTLTTVPATGQYVCVQRGADSRVWQRAVLITNQSGAIRTNYQSYNELATGLCHLVNGAYVDSVEEIDPSPNGAQATQGRYQVEWTGNADTPGGAVNLTTEDGKQLLSTVYGLAYSDTASGSNVMLATIQSCTGTILSARTCWFTAMPSMA